MDVSNVRTPFLVDGLRFKITLQNIYLIIWDAAMIGTVVVLPYYNRAQPPYAPTLGKLTKLLSGDFTFFNESIFR